MYVPVYNNEVVAGDGDERLVGGARAQHGLVQRRSLLVAASTLQAVRLLHPDMQRNTYYKMIFFNVLGIY